MQDWEIWEWSLWENVNEDGNWRCMVFIEKLWGGKFDEESNKMAVRRFYDNSFANLNIISN